MNEGSYTLDTRHDFSEYVLVRVAGLPIARIEALCLHRTRDLIDRLVELEAWAAARRESLCESLFKAVHHAPSKDARRRLMKLKRDIFNDRTLFARWKDDVDLVPMKLRPELEAWCACAAKRAALVASARETFEIEVSEKRRELRRVVEDETFRKAIASTYPDLLRRMDAYRDVSERLLTKRERRIEAAITLFATRMATRPTPLSTFAGIGLGRWSREASVPLARLSPDRRRSKIRLNHAIFQAILGRLSSDPEIRPSLRPTVNPSLSLKQDEIVWIRTDAAPLTGGTTLQSFSKMKRTLGPVRVLRAVRAAEGRRTYAQITESLGDASPLLDRMIDAQLIDLRIGVPDLCHDHLRALIDELGTYPSHAARATRVRLIELEVLLNAYASAASSGRLIIKENIASCVGALLESVGLAHEMASLDRSLLYEDVALEFDLLAIPSGGIRAMHGALALWKNLLACFDRSLGFGLAAAGFFVERYGPQGNVDVISFFRDYFTTFKSKLRTLPEQDHRSADVEQRDVCQKSIRERWEQIQNTDALEVELDATTFADLLEGARLPGDFEPSVGFLGQFTRRDGRLAMVINQVPGLGKFCSRFSYLFGRTVDGTVRNDLTSSLAAQARALGGKDRLVADLGGVFGFNANQRCRQTDWLIDYPGTVPDPSARGVLALGELSVTFNPQTRRLRFFSEKVDKEVIPADLGLMMFSVPPLYHFLANASPAGCTVASLPRGGEGPSTPSVRRLPRMCIGDVIVQRRRWIVPKEALPSMKIAEDAFEWFLAVRRWRHANGLPDHCYITTLSLDDVEREIKDAVRSVRDAEDLPTFRDQYEGLTPVFIDFASPFHVDVFRRIAKRVRRELIAEEVLPSLEEQFVEAGGERYVSEIFFEWHVRQESAL